MDDFIILSNDKNYLKVAKEKIIKYINLYKLEINENKTYIVDLKNGFNFLGYNFKLINNKTIINLVLNSKRNIRKGIKRNNYRFKNKIINFEKYFCLIENYIHSYPFVHKDKVKHIIERYY